MSTYTPQDTTALPQQQQGTYTQAAAETLKSAIDTTANYLAPKEVAVGETATAVTQQATDTTQSALHSTQNAAADVVQSGANVAGRASDRLAGVAASTAPAGSQYTTNAQSQYVQGGVPTYTQQANDFVTGRTDSTTSTLQPQTEQSFAQRTVDAINPNVHTGTLGGVNPATGYSTNNPFVPSSPATTTSIPTHVGVLGANQTQVPIVATTSASSTQGTNPAEAHVQNIATGLAGMILTAPQAALEHIAPALSANLTSATSQISTHASNLTSAVQQKIPENAGQQAQAHLGNAASQVQGVAQGFGEQARDFVHNLVEKAEELLHLGGEKAAEVTEGAKANVAATSDYVQAKASDATSVASDAATTASNKASDLSASAANTASNAATTASNKASDLTTSAANTVSNAADNVSGKAGEVAQSPQEKKVDTLDRDYAHATGTLAHGKTDELLTSLKEKPSLASSTYSPSGVTSLPAGAAYSAEKPSTNYSLPTATTLAGTNPLSNQAFSSTPSYTQAAASDFKSDYPTTSSVHAVSGNSPELAQNALSNTNFTTTGNFAQTGLQDSQNLAYRG